MADFDWPTELPPSPLLDGLAENPYDPAIRTSFDAGVDQVRKRFSSGVRKFELSLLLTSAQVQILDDFYYNSLGGSLAFNYTHFRTGDTREFRFVGPPAEYRPVTGNLFRVPITLEMLP